MGAACGGMRSAADISLDEGLDRLVPDPSQSPPTRPEGAESSLRGTLSSQQESFVNQECPEPSDVIPHTPLPMPDALVQGEATSPHDLKISNIDSLKLDAMAATPSSPSRRMRGVFTRLLSCGRGSSEFDLDNDRRVYLLCYDPKRRRCLKRTIRHFWPELKVLKWPASDKGEVDSLYFALKRIIEMQNHPEYHPMDLTRYLVFCGVFSSFGCPSTIQEMKIKIEWEIGQIVDMADAINPATQKIMVFEVPEEFEIESGSRPNDKATVIIVSTKDGDDYTRMFSELTSFGIKGKRNETIRAGAGAPCGEERVQETTPESPRRATL